MLTEFGGIAYSRDTQHTWGYSRARAPTRSPAATRTDGRRPIASRFVASATRSSPTPTRSHGLLYMDRTPKFRWRRWRSPPAGQHDEREREI